jgi:hypothetical protein
MMISGSTLAGVSNAVLTESRDGSCLIHKPSTGPIRRGRFMSFPFTPFRESEYIVFDGFDWMLYDSTNGSLKTRVRVTDSTSIEGITEPS